MASQNPFTFQGTLAFPPDEGQQPVPVAFGLANQYQSILDGRYVLTGSGSLVVPFGSVGSPGAKGMLIEVEAASGAQPVQVNVNGGTDDIEISPGGFLAYGSPNPATGITSLTIVYASDAVVRVRLFG